MLMTRCFCYLVSVTLPHTPMFHGMLEKILWEASEALPTNQAFFSQSVGTSLFEEAAPVFSSQMRPGRWAALHSEGNLCCSWAEGLNLSSFGGESLSVPSS